MYLTHYKLSAKPFQISCDPKFLWLGEKHKEALAMLRYGIMDNRGFLLLTGEVGTGKTLLINRLTTQLPADTVVATLPDPSLTRMDFYRLLADGFNISSPFNTKGEFLIQLRSFLYRRAKQRQRVVLIIDEAQRLGHRLIEEIRVLSNIDNHDRKLINIFFVGQQEFNNLLMEPHNRALAQRITLRFHLDSLSLSETGSYIHHRLKIAGNSKPIFKTEAIKKVFDYSSGIPRLINILCDHALLTNFVRNNQKIDADIITECAADLHLPTHLSSITTIRHTNNPSAIIGMPSAYSSRLANSGVATIRSKKNVAKKKKRHRPKHLSTVLSYAGVAALIIMVWGIAIINISERPWQVPDGNSKVYSSRNALPGTIKPLFVSHRKQTDLPETKAAQKATHTIETDPGMALLSPPVRKGPHSDRQSGLAREPMPTIKRRASQRTVAFNWPKETKVFVDFDPANQIANRSLATINQVATYLLKFPERVIYIHGYAGKEDMPEHRRTQFRRRINTLKTSLIRKGAYATQIQVIAMAIPAAKNPMGQHHGSQAVIEFAQRHIYSKYNPDK